MTETEIKKACLIGCGASGMPAVKALLDRGISFDCFEAGSDIGGNWAINNSNGQSACYESLRINTTREAMEYADLPMPDDYPTYPDHRQIKAYFDSYAARFELREAVQFNTRVESCRQLDSGHWQVQLEDGSEYHYENLLVANGHHWDPNWPEPAIPGEFAGLVMHSHSYRSPYDPIDFSGKNIVVVGMGNSAVDIACELSQPSLENTVYLSVRNSAWVLPRYLFGVPIGMKMPFPLPWKPLSWLAEALLRLSGWTPMAHGLARPPARVLQSHPTISQYLYDRLDNGELLAKPGIQQLKGQQVSFSDGSEVDADIVIYATGYKVSFPFFDPQFISAPDNRLPLWQQLLKPDVNNLFFIGLIQPLGALMPLAEKQAGIVADLIDGTLRLPALQDMLEDIHQQQATLHARYEAKPRHTMQVDAAHYDRQLDQLREAAQERAKNAPQLSGSSSPATKELSGQAQAEQAASIDQSTAAQTADKREESLC